MLRISIEKLGNLINEKRKEKELTQQQLGSITKINRQVIGRIESGQVIPSINQLEAILNVLEIDFNDIVVNDTVENNVLAAMRGKAESEQETEALNKMISMMLCLKKHDILRSKLNAEG